MIEVLQELVKQGESIGARAENNLNKALTDFKKWKLEIIKTLKLNGIELEKIQELKVILHYKYNEFDEMGSKKKLIEVISNSNLFLETLNDKDSVLIRQDLNESCVLTVIRRILSNFYLHIKAMYKENPHKRGTIKVEDLNKINIGNEYDVQKILYALLKPVFPMTRLEKNDDTGYGGIRYDIVIEEYDVIIEVKCSRASMSERSLTEEIGADICHYNARNLFFFIYDKDNIIKNPEVFKATYTKVIDKKNIETYIVQQVAL